MSSKSKYTSDAGDTTAAKRVRRFICLPSIFFALTVVGAACSDSELAPPASTDAPRAPAANETSTTAVADTAAGPSPKELAGRLLTAYAGSDPTAWRRLFASDSDLFAPIDWFFLEDFDGDGVTTFADWQQFRIALHDASGFECDWTCETAQADEARCWIASTDAFYELAGASPPPVVAFERFENGLWVSEETEPADGSAAWQDEVAAAEERRDSILAEYADWVASTHSEHYSAVFDGSAEDESLDWVTLPSAVPVHEELMAEYLAAARAGLLSSASAGTM